MIRKRSGVRRLAGVSVLVEGLQTDRGSERDTMSLSAIKTYGPYLCLVHFVHLYGLEKKMAKDYETDQSIFDSDLKIPVAGTVFYLLLVTVGPKLMMVRGDGRVVQEKFDRPTRPVARAHPTSLHIRKILRSLISLLLSFLPASRMSRIGRLSRSRTR